MCIRDRDELDIDIQVLQETGVFETADIENGLREMPLDDLRISLIAQDGSVPVSYTHLSIQDFRHPSKIK